MKTVQILLLEDSPLDAEFLLDRLEEGGLDGRITRVDSRESFASAIEKGQYDLILADYSLPLFNGMEALDMAQQTCPDIPFIFVSGRLGEELAIESLQRGATDYVVKQRLERLVPAVKRALAEAEEKRERQRVERVLSMLSEASLELSSSLDYQVTLTNLARLAVPHLADFCLVDIVTDEGRIRRLEGAHADPQFDPLVHRLQPFVPKFHEMDRPLIRVLNSGQPVVLEHLDDQSLNPLTVNTEHKDILVQLGVHTVMIVPLQARGRVLGALSFGACKPERTYTSVDLSLAQDLARRAALAVDNAYLHQKSLQALRLRDEFVATVSHELRTPLNAILGWATLLRGGHLNPEETVQGLATIERNAQAQAKMVEDLLDVSRIMSGKLPLHRQAIRLDEIVAETVAGMQPVAAARGVVCTSRTELGPGAKAGAEAPLETQGDPHRVSQILWNLLSNSIKFTPAGGQVEVLLTREEKMAVVTVSDSGPGIPAGFLPHVFERFRQADSSSTRRFGGLGLGLAIVRQLVELHGGTVTATSPGRLGGATFEVRLPIFASQGSAEEEDVLRLWNEANSLADRAPAPAPFAAASGQRVLRLQGLIVLVVDDDSDAREVIRLMLQRHGASVFLAQSAPEALDIVATQPVDVLLSDIGMPDQDGLALIRQVRALRQEEQASLPAAAVTAYTRQVDMQRARDAGFDGFIAKPMEAETLVQTILAVREGKFVWNL